MEINPGKLKFTSHFRRAGYEHMHKKYVRYCCENGWYNPMKRHGFYHYRWLVVGEAENTEGLKIEWRRTTQRSDYRSQWVNNIPDAARANAWCYFIREYNTKLKKHEDAFDKAKESWRLSMRNLLFSFEEKVDRILGTYSGIKNYKTEGRIAQILEVNRLQLKEVSQTDKKIAHLYICLSVVMKKIRLKEIIIQHKKRKRKMKNINLKIETDQDLRDSTAYVLVSLLNGDMPVSHANAFKGLVRNIISMNGQRIRAQIYNGVKTVKIPQLDSSSFSRGDIKELSA